MKNKVSWGKPEPMTILEIQAAKCYGLRYRLAQLLVTLAGRIINSKVIRKQTLPILEAK